jgi:hypothetical protein
MGLSSQAIAGDGVQHRACQKSETNGYEHQVEHGNLTISARSQL